MPRDIREVRFDGTFRERGLQRGRRLRETLTIPEVGPVDEDFVDACAQQVQQAYPPALEEFEAILEASDFDRARFRAYYFARLESRVGCTMVALPSDSTPPGTGAVVGHNYDWATADRKWCELHRYRNPDGRRRLAYTHHWAGEADVLNDAGLFVCISALPPAPVRAPGMQWNLAVDMVSECCETVEEAVEKLASVRHLRPMSYMLADAGGDAAIVEALPGEVRCRRADDAPIAAANVRRGGELLKDWTGPLPPGSLDSQLSPGADLHDPESEEWSVRRVERVLELPDDGTADLSAVESALSDHESPVCRHRNPRWGTIWSAVCLPHVRTLHIAAGAPCRTPYRRFALHPGGRTLGSGAEA